MAVATTNTNFFLMDSFADSFIFARLQNSICLCLTVFLSACASQENRAAAPANQSVAARPSQIVSASENGAAFQNVSSVPAKGKASKNMSLEDFSEKISQADTSNISFARKKLLDILLEQNKFYARMGKDSRMKASESLSAYRRINSLWEGYLLENGNDVHARILFGKFLRKTGNISDAYAQFCIADKQNSGLAVLKHQMAVYEGETGMVKEAYSHMLQAIEIEPENALYQSQMAKLLTVKREEIRQLLNLDDSGYDALILSHYRSAAKLEPDNYRIQSDYALAFYDISKADWNAALQQWNKVENLCALQMEKQIVLANKARVLIELNRDSQAEEILREVTLPSLWEAKQKLSEEIVRARKEANAPKSPEKKSYIY